MIDGFDWLWVPRRAKVMSWPEVMTVIVVSSMVGVADEARLPSVLTYALLLGLVVLLFAVYCAIARSWFGINAGTLVVHRHGRTSVYERRDIEHFQFSYGKTGAAVIFVVPGPFLGITRPRTRFLPGLAFCGYREGRDLHRQLEYWLRTGNTSLDEASPNMLRASAVVRPRVTVLLAGELVLAAVAAFAMVRFADDFVVGARLMVGIDIVLFAACAVLSWRFAQLMWWVSPTGVGRWGVLVRRSLSVVDISCSRTVFGPFERLAIRDLHGRVRVRSWLFSTVAKCDRDGFVAAVAHHRTGP